MTPDDLPSIESIAEYWDRRPCNIGHSPAERGSRRYFDEVEQRRYFVEPHIPAFADFQQWTGRRVLEVGCGIGTDAANFARAGADYTGVDVSEASVQLARLRFDVFGLSGRFVLANAEDLPTDIPEDYFDLGFLFGVIHHTPDPLRALREVCRRLKPHGELRLMVYAKNSWKDAMIEAGFDQPEAQSGCPIARTYTRREIRDLVEAAEFRIISISQTHIFPYVVEKYRKYEYEVQPWFVAMPPAMFSALQQRFGWHLLIVAQRA